MSDLASRYRDVRAFTDALAAPLSAEDTVIQSMPDVSPTKWHMAHTSWFFETFVLARDADYTAHHPAYAVLFNSYYNTVGEQFPRAQRGLLSRPTLDAVRAYRAHVDAAMVSLLAAGVDAATAAIVEVGLHHEEQHQELLLTDIKHVFSVNPLRPAYRARETNSVEAPGCAWRSFDEGIREIGARPGTGFTFDNEQPRHRVFLEAFALATRPVSNGDLIAFLEDGGYQTHSLWHSEGWATVQTEGWTAPFYWEKRDGRWFTMTLAGMQPVALGEAACHLSWFEASAFAEWAGARLPTEAEWEVASAEAGSEGAFADDGRFHPAPLRAAGEGLTGMFGDTWEWTASPYVPYPGYRAAPGALGEYNGKFMANQYVLRGGSCLTRRHHVRASYRNFFPSSARWQMTGARLAR
ncbi:MAG: ergothioneine biosynthesis protein EgtB [Sandaracinaceae bacterium]